MSAYFVEALNDGVQEFCFDSTSNLLRSITGAQTGVRTYSQYQPFAGRQFPRLLELIENGSAVTALGVTSLTEETFDDSLFAPLPSSIQMRTCDRILPPSGILPHVPGYRLQSYLQDLKGPVDLYVWLDDHGAVKGAWVQKSPDENSGKAALAFLNAWRFQPASCGDTRVPFGFTLIVPPLRLPGHY